MDALLQLSAIEAIRTLKARYFRCVDTKDWDGLAEVFSTNIEFDRTVGMAVRDPWSGAWSPPISDEPIIVRGRDAVMAMVRTAVEHVRTVHHGFMPEIEVLNDAEARGVWAMRDEIYDKRGRLIVSGSGHYHETYERAPQRWVISTSKLTRLWLTRGDGERGA